MKAFATAIEGVTDEERHRPKAEARTDKPVIRVIGGQLPEIATAGERAIITAGMEVYSREKSLVRPIVEEVEAAHGRRTDVPRLVPVDGAHLRDLLCRCATWERLVKREKEWVKIDAPHDVATTILARFGEWKFSSVCGVLSTPTLRPDGSLLATPGYDPATQLLLMAPPPMPSIAAKPTRSDAAAALSLLDGLLDEFVFVDDASRSVALSALITPIVRGAFAVTPMHVARAPVAGSGKSYLFDIAAAIAIGQPCPVIAAGRDEIETEKRLGAALMAGQPIISLDNLNGELGGDALCQIVERPIVQIRVLGKSELVRIEARATTTFATGNNIVLVGDMTRRVIMATVDPKLERPELRAFRRNPVVEVLADRGRYIRAALTIAMAYRAAGSPDLAPRLASFEGWSDTVRSALIWLGRADPVETMGRARAEDPVFTSLSAILGAWKAVIGTDWINRRTLRQVIELAEEGATGDYRYPELREAVANVATIRGRLDAKTFGNWARRSKDRVVNGCRLSSSADDHGHAAQWYLEEV